MSAAVHLGVVKWDVGTCSSLPDTIPREGKPQGAKPEMFQCGLRQLVIEVRILLIPEAKLDPRSASETRRLCVSAWNQQTPQNFQT